MYHCAGQQPPGTAVVTIRKALDHDTSAEPDQQLWFKAQEQIDNPVRAGMSHPPLACRGCKTAALHVDPSVQSVYGFNFSS